MTVADQLKIIVNKIKANQAQYDLDRLVAKIFAYSSGDLRKYKYRSGEDLGYKGLHKDHKKEGFFKRLENIKDKNEELVERI